MKAGECEQCESIGSIHLVHGRIWLCLPCKEQDERVLAESIRTTNQSREAQSMLHNARRMDTAIELKQDIYMSNIPATVELRAAIEADESIPSNQKQYAYTKATNERALHLQSVLFELRKAVNERENEYKLWVTETQTNAAKLSSELREQFKSMDISYAPRVMKPTKQPTIKTAKTGPKKDSAQVVKEVAEKYGLMAPMLKMTMEGQKMNSAEEAAQFLMRTTGLGKVTQS